MTIHRYCLLIVCVSLAASIGSAEAQPDRPVYQRHSTSWRPEHDRHPRPRHDDRHRQNMFKSQQQQPQVSSGWFQRPYPYHLDFYKMRYGGSYEPYFGNLYGPPIIVAPSPFFGGFGFDFWQQQPQFGGIQPGLGGAPWGNQPGQFAPYAESFEEPVTTPVP
jgi:hypothetical protein